MRLSKVLEGIEIINNTFCDVEVTSVTSSSHDICNGCLFVAINGLHYNGNDYIDYAVSNGAVCIVCENLPSFMCDNVTYIHVKNCRKAYSYISDNFYCNPSKKMKFIGITGTNGKTTTAYMIWHIMTQMNMQAGLISTVETKYKEYRYYSTRTTPEALDLYRVLSEFYKRGCHYVIMEVSSQGLDQHRCDPIQFDAGIFLNISNEHLDYHHDIDSYIKSKLQLAKQSNKCIVNYDDKYLKDHFDDSTVYISQYENVNYFISEIESYLCNLKFKIRYKNEEYYIQTPISGYYNIYNIAAAVAVCESEGIDLNQCSKALSSYKGVKGRFDLVGVYNGVHVIIDYAHTPESLRNILECTRKLCNGNLYIVFGCGGNRDETKRPMMGKISSDIADNVIITNDNPRNENQYNIISNIISGIPVGRPYTVIPDRKEAIISALSSAGPNDFVLIAGKGHEQYQIIEDCKIPFNEFEIVKEFFKEKE